MHIQASCGKGDVVTLVPNNANSVVGISGFVLAWVSPFRGIPTAPEKHARWLVVQDVVYPAT